MGVACPDMERDSLCGGRYCPREVCFLPPETPFGPGHTRTPQPHPSWHPLPAYPKAGEGLHLQSGPAIWSPWSRSLRNTACKGNSLPCKFMQSAPGTGFPRLPRKPLGRLPENITAGFLCGHPSRALQSGLTSGWSPQNPGHSSRLWPGPLLHCLAPHLQGEGWVPWRWGLTPQRWT